jgi:hypothetical protein
MSFFKDYLNANARSIREVVPNATDRGIALRGIALRGIALIDAMQSEIFYLHGILKTGVIFADLDGLVPVAYPSERATRKRRSIVNSLCGCVVPVRRMFLRVLLVHFFAVLKRIVDLRNRRDILSIEIDGCKIGPYIYDAVYRPLVEQVTIWQRIKVAYFLLCHYLDRMVIDAYPVELALVSDPAGRTGMFFALCRTRGIRTINAINIDVLQMQKYFSPCGPDPHYRDVPESALALLERDPSMGPKIDEYFAARFQGAIAQHDVVRAFSSHKVILSRAQLCTDYGLVNPELPLVFVMAHVLTDAPHAYAPTLYRDYEEWVLRTVLALARNPRVNFLVKEHPSIELYGESGILRRMLEKTGWQGRLLFSNVHTGSVLTAADAVITCGGTIGIEASSLGIPVVLAAKPPYAGKGFTVEPSTAAEYEELLARRIGDLERLGAAQVLRAKQVAYVLFELFDNDAPTLEFGGVPFVRGQRFEEKQFYRNIVKESRTPLRRQKLYQRLQQYYWSDDPSILNYGKLQSALTPANR